MSSSNESSKKIGGEYGEVRANIDADNLNAYLAAHVAAVTTPVSIKQFKVRRPLYYVASSLTRRVVWTGSYFDRGATERVDAKPEMVVV